MSYIIERGDVMSRPLKYSDLEREEWFAYYVSLGEKRSYDKVAEHFNVPKPVIVATAIKNKWRQRLENIKDRLDEIIEEKLTEKVEPEIEDFIDNITKFQRLISVSLSKYIESQKTLEIKHTRDFLNLVEAFQKLVEVELKLKEGSAENIAIILDRDIIPKIEEAIGQSTKKEQSKMVN